MMKDKKYNGNSRDSPKEHKKVARDEFRFNNKTRHKNYVFEESNGKYSAIGITHKSKTYGKKNMPLKKNPQKGKTEKAYVRNGIIRDDKSSFGRKLNNYEFDVEDKANVKSKIRNYKKRRKKNTSGERR